MAQAGLNVQLSIKEIYEAACPECKVKIRGLIKEKLTDDMVDKIIGT